MSYDRALSVFSPDGRLLQVEYGNEAVKRGTTAVGIRGADVCILACERKTLLKLQDDRATQKICHVDDHVSLAFAGLNADARILVDKARVEAQSHRLTLEDPVSIDYITRYVAGVQQKYTQSGGVRPFGIATLICGFDPNDTVPRLYMTEPAGIYSAWRANAIGKSSKTVREFLERNWKEGLSRAEAVKLAVGALLEVVQTGAKNIEVCVLAKGQRAQTLPEADVEAVVKEIADAKEQEAQRKRDRAAGIGAGTGAAAGSARTTGTSTPQPPAPAASASSAPSAAGSGTAEEDSTRGTGTD